MTKKPAIFIFGLAVTALALVLSLHYHYKHFYEFLVVGLALTLSVPVGAEITADQYKDIGRKFVKAGLVGDLLFGVTITGLWHYNYHSIWDYVPLYLIVYPFAGAVMLQSFVLVKRRLLPAGPAARRLSERFYSQATRFFIGLSLGLIVATILAQNRHILLPAMFLSVSLYVLVVWSHYARRAGAISLLDEFYSRPLRMLGVLLIVSYFNAFFHELPNTVAHEWTYTSWPLQNVQVFKIPLLVLVGWPYLTLYPVAVYYYVMAEPKHKSLGRQSLLAKLFPLSLPPKRN